MFFISPSQLLDLIRSETLLYGVPTRNRSSISGSTHNRNSARVATPQQGLNVSHKPQSRWLLDSCGLAYTYMIYVFITKQMNLISKTILVFRFSSWFLYTWIEQKLWIILMFIIGSKNWFIHWIIGLKFGELRRRLLKIHKLFAIF